MTIRKGSENFFYKLEGACALAVKARSKPGYTVLQSRQKNGGKLSIFVTVSLSVSLPVSVSVALTLALTLAVNLFVCDSCDSRSFMLYFTLALSIYLSEGCSLSISLSRKLVLSLTLSLFVCHFLTLSLPL